MGVGVYDQKFCRCKMVVRVGKDCSGNPSGDDALPHECFGLAVKQLNLKLLHDSRYLLSKWEIYFVVRHHVVVMNHLKDQLQLTNRVYGPLYYRNNSFVDESADVPMV